MEATHATGQQADNENMYPEFPSSFKQQYPHQVTLRGMHV